jgi:hypothetical protein
MHIDLSYENENSVRELSNRLDLSSAFIVNMMVKAACFELASGEVVIKYNKDFIEKMRVNLKLSQNGL